MVKLHVKRLMKWKEKLKGLTGVEPIYPVYFETRFGIHTFGLKKAMDVLILNKNNEVADMKLNLRPGRIFLWNPKYFKVIELPAEKYKISIGEKVIMSNYS